MFILSTNQWIIQLIFEALVLSSGSELHFNLFFCIWISIPKPHCRPLRTIFKYFTWVHPFSTCDDILKFCREKQEVRSGDFAKIHRSPAGRDSNNHQSGYLSVQPLCRRPGRDRIWRLILVTGTVKGTIPNTLLSSSHLRRAAQGSYVQL